MFDPLILCWIQYSLDHCSIHHELVQAWQSMNWLSDCLWLVF